MMRTLYAALLWLHPRDFRQKFSEEMLCVFDEAAESEGMPSLLTDILLSLLRQWVMRREVVTITAGVVGGLLVIIVDLMIITQLRPFQ